MNSTMPSHDAMVSGPSSIRPGHIALIVLLLLIGFSFRLFFIGKSDLWLDELWSVTASSPYRTASEVAGTAVADGHPPLFDLALHYWLRLRPGHDLWGRYFSLLTGAAGMVLSFYYARRIAHSTVAGLLALSLLAVNHFHTAYSIESRYYSLLYLLSLGVVSHLIFYTRGGRPAQLAAFAVYGLALVFTHLYGTLFFCGLGLAMGIVWLGKGVRARIFLRYALVSAGVLLLFLPTMIAASRTINAAGWLQIPSMLAFFEYAYNYSHKNPVEAAYILLPLLLSYRVYRRDRVLAVLLVGSILFTYALAYGITVLYKPVLHERYTIVYFPSMVLLASAFWSGEKFARRPAVAAGVAAAVALSGAINLAWVNPYSEWIKREPWKDLAQHLAERTRTDGLPAFCHNPEYVNYYTRRFGGKWVQPLSALGAEPAFWYVATGYDAADFPDGRSGLTEVGRESFPGGKFALVRYVRTSPAP